MAKSKMPHPGHDTHLCFLRNIGFIQSHLAEYKELVTEAKYVCRVCGRVAADRKNLCKPTKL